mmetsp:Transcript_12918/g.28538  ORF Transcript_12918/g.28538 Transcript_12918/m.28538 type:complete len:335 (-) Transcript_12918:1196-2200(-)
MRRLPALYLPRHFPIFHGNDWHFSFVFLRLVIPSSSSLLSSNGGGKAPPRECSLCRGHDAVVANVKEMAKTIRPTASKFSSRRRNLIFVRPSQNTSREVSSAAFSVRTFSSSARKTWKDDDDVRGVVVPMDRQELFQNLGLSRYSDEEIKAVFRSMLARDDGNLGSTGKVVLNETILAHFLLERYRKERLDESSKPVSEREEDYMRRYATHQSRRMLAVLCPSESGTHERGGRVIATSVDLDYAACQVRYLATTVHRSKVYPVAGSMLLVGTSVGVLSPVMPFFVDLVGLTPAEFGTVVGSFGAAKLVGNIPCAVFAERHGRKVCLCSIMFSFF